MNAPASRRAEKARALQQAFLREMSTLTLFHRVFDALPGLHFFAKDRSGQLLFVSRGILEHHHLAEEWEAVGKTDFDLNPGSYAKPFVADDEVVYATGEPMLNRVEIWFDRVGLPDWFVTNKFPIRDRKGRIIGIMGTMESCAERRVGAEPFVEIQPAVNELRRRRADPPSIAEAAKVCGLSVRQLQRKFQAIYGMSPQTFQMKTRIRAACDALRRTNSSIAQIAGEVGFSDQSSFTLHFRKHTGTTPRRYQAETRKG
jgi:AraC-like DNA-binding protein